MKIRGGFDPNDENLHEIVPGVRVPIRVKVTVTGYQHGPSSDDTITIGVVLVAGRYQCEELRIQSREEITTASLRSLPVTRLIKWGVQSAVTVLPVVMPDDLDSCTDEERLRAVAAVYSLEHLVGGAPNEAVRNDFRIGKATATRWIADARKGGYFRDAEIGRARR